MTRNPHEALDEDAGADELSDDVSLNQVEDGDDTFVDGAEKEAGSITVAVDSVDELKTVLAAELSTDTTQHYLNQIGARPL